MSSGSCDRLDELIGEFAELEPRERLELLLEYAGGLPPLPPEYQALRDAGQNRVHECMTPVWLWVTAEEGRLQILAEVAEEAPTVKGFVALLAAVYSGLPAAEAAPPPPDFLGRLGLAQTLGMTRLRGLQAILHRVGQQVALAQDR